MSESPFALGHGIYHVPSTAKDKWRKATERPPVPPEDPDMVAASAIAQVYIFNVGPWPCSFDCGSMGKLSIPAAQWRVNVQSITIPGFPSEPYFKSDDSNPNGYWVRLYHRPVHGRHSPGMDFAIEAIHHPSAKWPEQATPFGVFASYSDKPQYNVLRAAQHSVLDAAAERIKQLVRGEFKSDLSHPRNDYDRQCLRILNHPKTIQGVYESAISAKEIDELLAEARGG